MQIEIPYLAREVEDEATLVFLAFFKQLNLIYGYNEMYTLHARDVHIILRSSKEPYHYFKQHAPIVNKLITIGLLPGDRHSFQFKNRTELERFLGNDGLEKYERISRRHIVDIKDEKLKQIWMYLMGCLNRNLITKKDEVEQKMHLSKYFKTYLTFTGESKNRIES